MTWLSFNFSDPQFLHLSNGFMRPWWEVNVIECIMLIGRALVCVEEYELEKRVIVFFFFSCTHSIWKFLSQGSNPGRSCDLCCCCSNSISLTHCNTVGTAMLVIYWRNVQRMNFHLISKNEICNLSSSELAMSSQHWSDCFNIMFLDINLF